MAPRVPPEQLRLIEARIRSAGRAGRLSEGEADELLGQLRRLERLAAAQEQAADTGQSQGSEAQAEAVAGLWQRFLAQAHLSDVTRPDSIGADLMRDDIAESPATNSSDEQVTAAEKAELAVAHLHPVPAADVTQRARNITLGLVFSILALISVAALIYQFRAVKPAWAILLAVPTLLLLAWGMAVRHKFPGTGTGLLAGVMALVPLNLLAFGYCTGQLTGRGLLIAWSVAGILALLVMFATARALRVPWALPTAMAAAILASAKLALRDEYLRFIPTYRPYVEFILLGVLALGVAAMLLGLYRRRRQEQVSLWLGAKVGALLLLWPFALVCVRLFTDFSEQLQAEWIGTWLVGLGIIFLLIGLVFLRIPKIPKTGAESQTRRFAIVLMALAGVAALAGLLLSDGHVMGMLISLAVIFVTTALLGTHCKGREVVTFQAIASAALPAWAAVWSLKVAGAHLPAGDSLAAMAVSSITAATGFALANSLVYLFGLMLVPREGHWTRSIPLVSSLALGVLGWFWLARLGGIGVIAVPGTDYQAAIPSIYLLFALPALLMVTAWRVRWELTVYLASLGLLVAVGIYTARSGSSMVFSSAIAAGLAIVGAALGPWRRRSTPAHYYCEGLLVMSLAGTVLMVLLVAVLGWDRGLNEDTIVLLAALSLTLLLASLVFKQEDLFGFFGLSLVLLALAVFHVNVGPREGSYLLRHSTVALATGLGLALVAAFASGWFRKRKGLQRFAPALYIPALAAAAFALALFVDSPNRYHRAIDLAAVAMIIALIRPHVRHAVTNYAVAAAVTAAVYMAVTARWGGSPVEMRQAALIATGGLSFVWILVALIVRRAILAVGALSDKEARRRGRPFTVVGMAMAITLAGWLTLMTVLSYHGAWAGQGRLARLLKVDEFSPPAAMIAWAGVLLAFLLSIWLFRRTWRTFLFYLVGSSATVGAGLLFGLSSKQLVSYLICSIPSYGGIHLLVYLRERQFMSLLSRHCALHSDEVHASTTIFTAGCISCFIGGFVAAFHLHTLAALVTLSIMATVFLIWSFGRRRPELLYPAVLFSVGALLAIWHYVEGLGPWTATRVNINSAVFAGCGLLWMAIGTALNRLRGPISVLNSPARQMSVVLALAGLGFLIVLAICPTWEGESWTPDVLSWRLILATACGLTLAGYFLWAAHSFRRTLFIYLVELSVATLLVLLATRITAVWNWPPLRDYWPLGLAGLSLVLLALATLLESRHRVLYSRPVFFTATVFLPILPFVGGILFLRQGHHALAAATFALLTVTCLLGSLVRARGLLRTLAALGINAMLACLWFARGVNPAVYPRLYLVPAGATIVALALVGRRGTRPRTSRAAQQAASQSSRRLLLMVGLLVAFSGCIYELASPELRAEAILSAGLTAIGLTLAVTVLGLQLRQPVLNYAAAIFLAVCLAAEVYAVRGQPAASRGALAIVVATAVAMVASGLSGLRTRAT